MNINHLTILFEDNHLIAVWKPAGILVQGDDTGDTPLVDMVKEYVKQKFDKPGEVFLGCIHRIDRPVSGVVVFARTSKALERMNKLFETRQIEKIYWAIVKYRPEVHEQTLIHYLKKDTEKNKVRAYDKEVKESKKAVLSYKLLKYMDNHSLLEIKPETGRPHQIRIQLSTIDIPIKGDLKYGYPTPNADKSINLHARELRFEHPVTKEMIRITAAVPNEEMWVKFVK